MAARRMSIIPHREIDGVVIRELGRTRFENWDALGGCYERVSRINALITTRRTIEERDCGSSVVH